MPNSDIYSISDITRTIKLLIEENIPTIWVEGEVSNFKPHYSGHYYFTLKDSTAQISAIMWKSRTSSITFVPEDGQLVHALGTIRLYEKSGRYQLDIIRMQPAGIGNLQFEFERLKQKLEAEGLFDTEHKKALPQFPLKIGIVTSSTGAAVKDIINVLSRRAPHIQIIVRSAKVQGDGAANDIAEGIYDFNEYGNVDLIIAGRGGGSLEDLWPFNEEVVARAIYNSNLPIISAVGHEIDFTIADFVSDLRAPTPSAAAELATPDSRELRDIVLTYNRRIFGSTQNKIEYLKDRINAILRSYGLRKPADLVRQYSMQIDELSNKLAKNFIDMIIKYQEYTSQLNIRLNNLNPKNVIERGYSITYINNKIVKDLKMVGMESEMRTEILKGEIISIVKQKKEN